MSDDLDLRQRFQELRDEERRAIPAFAASAPRPRARVTHWAPLAATAALLLILSTVVVTLRPRSVSFTTDDRVAARAVAQWHPQTDFLLRTPGSELLTSTPSIPDDSTRSVAPSTKGVSQ
jgi:hypothetical protein